MTHKLKLCPSCGTQLQGEYCHACGERRFSKSDYSLSRFFEQSVDLLTHYDSKFYRSIALLVAKPGFLTEEYFKGRRVDYVKPLQLFVLINIVYFFAVSLLGWNTFATHLDLHRGNAYYGSLATSMVESRIQERNTTFVEYQTHFDHTSATLSKTLIFTMIPLLALLLQLLYWRPRRYFVENLIFSIHFFAFLLLYITATEMLLALAFKLLGTSSQDVTKYADIVATVSTAAGTFTYLVLALKRVRGQSILLTLTKSALVTYMSFWLLWTYRFILFLSCYYVS
jgi:hypothetical protein